VRTHEHLHSLRRQGGTDDGNGRRRVMIWINHRQAIVAVFVGRVPDDWLAVYGRGPHPERLGNWLLHRIESHQHETLRSFHDEIARYLSPADTVLLLGPGRPKHQLARRLVDEGGYSGQVVHLGTVAGLAERELLAYAEAFFIENSVQPSSTRLTTELSEGVR
jgi:hypothetical protein